ncbi:DNA polymerase III subunit delta [Alloscardovia theropitheci]|uniref:DNA-directed DNA polymerase n=2 Tax=Alloscardovia theropitheci TaxID=2496842 RepID=A0A4R0QVY4_9BIFI|nr:DNA polymerase III subunit delta [Alloscardovia theropitheci]
MERIDLDASTTSEYDFIESVSPSLLSDGAIVYLDNLENSSDKLSDAIDAFATEHKKRVEGDSVVICRKSPGQKGMGHVNRLKKSGANVINVPQLKTERDYRSFITGECERYGRFMTPDAIALLIGVLSGRTGEIAAMCNQLCSDFDENPITEHTVSLYMVSNPQVTGFNVSDKAMAGDLTGAIVDMRNAVVQGMAPIAIIGALASNLRSIAKVAAVESGQVSQSEANFKNSWVYNKAKKNLRGWTSQGLAHGIQMCAWADEQCKKSGNDPLYALEKTLECIASHGKVTVEGMNS